MSKLEERESRRKGIVSNMIEQGAAPAVGEGRGLPKEERELKKRRSLSVFPSVYEDIQKIAYVQRKSMSELMGQLMEEYIADHAEDLKEYQRLKAE